MAESDQGRSVPLCVSDCEVCGEPGETWSGRGSDAVLCDEHIAQSEAALRSVPLFVCADCGRTLTLQRGRWADEREPGSFHFTCRDHTRAMPDGTLRLEAADYHYVAGETQRRWSILEARRG